MALRKVKHISSGSQQMDENTQEEDDDSATDGETGDEFSSLLLSSSSTREKRWRKRKKKAKQKTVGSEMTEEEMMDLALRLSEREASASALQREQEEEAVLKAIQESMVSQTQPGLDSSSKPLLADASLWLGSRQKLVYSNGVKMSATDQAVLEDGSTPETDQKSEAKGAGDEKIPCKKERKRKAGSPLLEMPDVASPGSVEPFSAALDSPQSSDSTQIDDSQLHTSPVFPSSGCRAMVRVDRLSQGTVETCRGSGFVLYSQDSWSITELRSPTFPRINPELSSKSPVFSGTPRVDSGQVERSPASGRKAQREASPSSCKRHDCEKSEVVFFSQESLCPSGRFCWPESPVFPKSPQTTDVLPPSDGEQFHKLILDREQAEENDEQPLSPVFGTTRVQLRAGTDEQRTSVGPERRGSREEKLDGKEETESDGCQVDDFHTRPSKSEQLTQKSRSWSCAETKMMGDVTLAWTDEDEDDNTLADSASPVFPEEKPLHQGDGQAASLTHEAAASQGHTRKQLSTTDEETRPVSSQQEEVCRESPPPGESSGVSTVHYYWGVPFCPRGLDPDTYTQVILAQMEVYQTSLKRAQRCLLRKAEWGEAVQPEPEKSPSPESPAKSPQLQFPRRRGLRLRGQKINEAAESSPAEEEEKMEEEKEQQEKEERNEGEEEQMDTDDCDVCPETQLSNDDAPELTVVTDAEAEISSQPPAKSPELPEVERILQHSSPVRDKFQEEEEEAVDADAKRKENISDCSGDAGSQTVGEAQVKEDSRDPDVQETKGGRLQRSASPELELAVVPCSPDAFVDCPICQASFPVSEIELHAAYCDGEVAIVGETRPDGDRFQESVKLPRKRTRRAERTPEGINNSPDICRKKEMCYVCRKAIPLREYSRHTELCCQTSRPKGNLLMALAQTDNRDSDAGPSGSKVQPEAVIDLRDDDDDEAAAAFRISDSPIRSFTSISEATGCLVDFKKQHRPKKPGQRRR